MRSKISKLHVGKFIREYTLGNPIDALRSIYTSPSLDFSRINRSDQEHFSALNLADSLVFAPQSSIQSPLDYFISSTVPLPLPDTMILEIEEMTAFQSPSLKIKSLFDEGFFKHLERSSLQAIMQLQSLKPMHSKVIKLLLKSLPKDRSKKLYRQINWLSNVYQARKKLAPVFSDFSEKRQSLYPLTYKPKEDLSCSIQKELSSIRDRVPVFFVSPYQIDWMEINSQLEEKEAIFVFQNHHQLYHCLESNSFSNLIFSPNHYILILNEHPKNQFLKQDILSNVQKKFSPICCTHKDSYMFHAADLIIELMERCVTKNEPQAFTDLYQLGRLTHENEMYSKLGPDRYMSISLIEKDINWHSLHKERASASILKPFSNNDFCSIKLNQIKPIYSVRKKHKKKKLHVAHVVPQIIDGNHSPSLLLRSMIDLGDHDKFQFSLMSTERLCLRHKEYPTKFYTSDTSFNRAAKTINAIEAKKQKYYIAPAMNQSLEETARQVSIMMSINRVDIAFFHSFDEINMMISRMCDVPFKVGFSHSDLPEYPGMDLLIACEKGSLINRERYDSWGMQSTVLEYVIDVRKGWDAVRYPKSFFEVDDDTKLLTTISNHLESRISNDMVWAIAQILIEIPNAYYMPVGIIHNMNTFMRRFKKFGIEGRVKPLGPHENPSQLMRSMDLYLNEFPFGGCASILDAMAASCPIISMHDEKGPPQSRHAGVFYGLDKVIHSNKRKDYVKLSSKLLTEPEFYDNWAQDSQRKYDKRTSPQKYVHTIERLLLSNFASKQVKKELVLT